MTPRFFLFFWNRAFKEQLPRMKVTLCMPCELIGAFFPLLILAGGVLVLQASIVLVMALAYLPAMLLLPILTVLSDDTVLAVLGFAAFFVACIWCVCRALPSAASIFSNSAVASSTCSCAARCFAVSGAAPAPAPPAAPVAF